jgi:hypothetical protein
MITLIWLFLISLLVLVAMVFHGHLELNLGKEIISKDKRQVTDKKLLTFYKKNITLLDRLYSSLRKLPEISKQKSHDIWQVVSKKVDSYFAKVKKKKSDNEKGAVSIYWQSVRESRNSEGEIEEK